MASHRLKPIPFCIKPLAGDASFRRYFRVQTSTQPYVVMDAPPAKEGLSSFLHVGKLLAAHGIHTPHVFAVDYALGFVLLEDLGDTLYFMDCHRIISSRAIRQP